MSLSARCELLALILLASVAVATEGPEEDALPLNGAGGTTNTVSPPITLTGDDIGLDLSFDFDWTGDHEFEAQIDFGTAETWGAADTTPDVSSGSLFKTNTGALTITDLTGSASYNEGKIIYVLTQTSGINTVTFATSTQLRVGLLDLVTSPDDVTSFIYDGTYWFLLSYFDSDANSQSPPWPLLDIQKIDADSLLLARLGYDPGDVTEVKISALTPEAAPATGDVLLGEESGGAMRKFDVQAVADLASFSFQIDDEGDTHNALIADGDEIRFQGTGTTPTYSLPGAGVHVINVALDSREAGAMNTANDTAPSALGEFGIDRNGDASTITTPVWDYVTAGPVSYHLFGVDAYPTVDQQVQLYDSATNKMKWGQPGGSSDWFDSWNAGEMHPEGLECSVPSERVMNSGPPMDFIFCGMGSSEVDGFIYGDTVLGPNFAQANDFVFQWTAIIVSAPGSNQTVHGQISIQCLSSQETIDNTWDTEVAFDIDIVTADVVNDIITDLSASVDAAGEGCVAGDTLSWRYRLCDDDSTPITGCSDQNSGSTYLEYLAMQVTNAS